MRRIPLWNAKLTDNLPEISLGWKLRRLAKHIYDEGQEPTLEHFLNIPDEQVLSLKFFAKITLDEFKQVQKRFNK